MSIELHCPQCGKLIRAPEDAGGKRGKCPYCTRTVYIPTPMGEEDVIPLAPVSPDEEAREAKLQQEAAKYAAALDKAEDAGAGVGGRAAKEGRPQAAGEVIDIGAEVVLFIRAMRDSKLDEADRTVEKLKKAGPRARDYIQGLMLDQMPLEVQNVSPALIQGFLKKLLDRLR